MLQSLFQRILLLIVLTTFSQLAPAQIFDNPKNLTVLPKDISAEDLRDSMKAISLGTGFRCSSCHIGEEGQALTSYDFVSDEKELKSRARIMMQMVNAINDGHLATLGDNRVRVNCVTCHRGVNKPYMTADILTQAAEQGGQKKMLSEYMSLREQYYGTHSYDFSDFTMVEFAGSRAAAGHNDEATSILDITLEQNPQSFMALVLYAQIEQQQGNAENAINYYTKAIAANPQAQGFIAPRIEKLKNSRKKQ